MSSQTPPTAIPVCYRHPSRETYVKCTRCERPICPDCMVEASVGHQCPECVREGRRSLRPTRTVFGGGGAGEKGYVTRVLIGLNVAVAILALYSARDSGGGFSLFGSSTPLHDWGALLPGPAIDRSTGQLAPSVATGDYYRLFTSMFLHYGLIHLLMNMWVLWVLGRTLEAALGPVRFLALYLVAGFGGSVAVYLFSAPNVQTAGASGAIFGLFAALFIILRRLKRDTSSVVPILVINLIITISVPGISIAGHLGGLVTGAIVSAGIAYAPKSSRNVVQAATLVGATVILALITALHTASINA